MRGVNSTKVGKACLVDLVSFQIERVIVGIRSDRALFSAGVAKISAKGLGKSVS